MSRTVYAAPCGFIADTDDDARAHAAHCDQCAGALESPDFDTAEAAGLDGTLRDGNPPATADDVKHAQAARADRLAVDKIATLLGTSPEWNGADFLTAIANIIGTVRPHPGDRDPEEYAGEFLAATGHVVDHEFDRRD